MKILTLLFIFLITLTQFDTYNSKKLIIKNNKGFILGSNSIKQNTLIDKKFTPQGVDHNPEFHWNVIPKGTKSFAFTLEDPDAPKGTFNHWLVANIPLNTKEIPENSIPGNQIINSWGIENYKGPSPPKGQKHRYFFKLFALKIDFINANDKDSFYKEINKYKIAESSIMGYYKK